MRPTTMTVTTLFFLLMISLQGMGDCAQDKQLLVPKTGDAAACCAKPEIPAALENLKETYFKDNRFEEFISALGGFGSKDRCYAYFIPYYISLARFEQLKYLEQQQKWEEYFNKGPDYRAQISRELQKALSSQSCESLRIYALRLNWLVLDSQGAPAADSSLEELISTTLTYAKSSGDVRVVKDIADTLHANDQAKKASLLYRIYADNLLASSVTDSDLKNIASGMLKQGNSELAKIIYDGYIEHRIKNPSPEVLEELKSIARSFGYTDDSVVDALYADKLLNQAQEVFGKAALGEDMLYLKAFNLQKAKEYIPAKDAYLALLSAFPVSAHADEAKFKVAVIQAYLQNDIKSAQEGLLVLAGREPADVFSSAANYNLGLISQWQAEAQKAQEYYKKVVLNAERFPEDALMAQARLKEIEEGQPMDYALKSFLDLSFSPPQAQNQVFMARSELKSIPYKARRGQEVEVRSDVYNQSSGCTNVEVQYLWSGSLSENPPSNQSSFPVTYKQQGTKVINLVIVSPSGVLDKNFDMIDVE